MKKFFLILFLAFLIGNAFSEDRMGRLGTLISNFTEVGFYNRDIQNLSNGEYIYFGVTHQRMNHAFKKSKAGYVCVPASDVETNVSRYFGKKLMRHDSISEMFYDRIKRCYEVLDPNDEQRIHAKVLDVQDNSDETLTVTGLLYDEDSPSKQYGNFRAHLKPRLWRGKDTWTLISIKTVD